ncbi:Putative uncharacterized protein [Mesomycoplasma hyopneumoniae 168]|uniref:Uncharacterized protein n=2 Tax=Mesomycoplasma hyopneumoniae (strain 168) TaxID=907287 RepID=E4QTQ5_MESH1|nr:hypothetical protein [Mesomycoplasma hyopneumoniae]ADQ90798.1 Putative uncharacterized protein [Mesomycoplasma hyopneumoniae 168]AGM22374.1 hypothetical protein MHP168L_605 [Mesomycoplasma hyopneumoniae 168-L]QBY87888.1 hypothetical protein E5E95_03410 [Mesomycoplasma hyopneumoniae]
MEIQLNSLIKIQEKFIENRYREVIPRDFISTRNIYMHWKVPPISEINGEKIVDCWPPLPYCDIKFMPFLEFNTSSSSLGLHNPIEDMIAIPYKQGDYIYRLRLDEIQKATFFSKELRFFKFYKKSISKEIYKIISERYHRVSKSRWNLDGIFWDNNSWNDIKMVVVAIENIEDVKNCQYSISFPSIFRMSYTDKIRLKEVEQLIINEIEELIPHAEPKNLENHREKIFDFLSIQNEYNSKYFDPNKVYLGAKIEDDLKKIEKEFQDFEANYPLVFNVKTLETYEKILEKFEKYNIKKFDLEKDDRSKILISWLDKFGPEYQKHCINLFGKDGEKYYDELEKWTNKINLVQIFQIMFGPLIDFVWTRSNYYITKPDAIILKSWGSLDPSKFELYYFGGVEYGIYNEILEQFDSKNPVFWLNTGYEPSGRTGTNGWIPDIITKNLILIYRDGENILYWIGKSPFYHHVYNGKYFPLNLYYNKKISDIERDIFLRQNKDPEFYSYKYDLNIDVIRRTNEQLSKLFDYINLYEKNYKKNNLNEHFENFLHKSDLLTKSARRKLSAFERTSFFTKHKKTVNYINPEKNEYYDFRFNALYKK